jgi:precorrin-2 dehydrogenase/sirohydrochlorin ferrochelatase
VIGISTSGKSPAMARRIREELEPQFGPEHGELADVLGELRDEVKARYSDPRERNRAYVRILDSDVLDLLAQGRRDEAIERARECI